MLQQPGLVQSPAVRRMEHRDYVKDCGQGNSTEVGSVLVDLLLAAPPV